MTEKRIAEMTERILFAIFVGYFMEFPPLVADSLDMMVMYGSDK